MVLSITIPEEASLHVIWALIRHGTKNPKQTKQNQNKQTHTKKKTTTKKQTNPKQQQQQKENPTLILCDLNEV